MDLPLAIVTLAGTVATVILSLFFGTFLYKRKLKRNSKESMEKAGLIIKEAEIQAETIKKDRIFEAKEKFLKMKSEFEDD